MKKLLLLALSFVMTSGLMAQVKVEDLRLGEAIAKAKKENKNVFMFLSATW